jgi:serine/threonine-protein kinase
MPAPRLRLPLPTLALVLAAGSAGAEAPPRFPPEAVWHQDISAAALHPQSQSMIDTWIGLGGFGYGRMQIDIGFKIVHAAPDAPVRTIVGWPDDDAYYLPDCEPLGTPMPVPGDARIEWQDGLQCDDDGDCHLLVVQGDRLYEAYRARAIGDGELAAQCLVIWKLERVYPPEGRGDHCTSADAAGFPIAPLLFNADEVHAAMQVADGDLGHAIRFILPNARMASTVVDGDRYGQYVRPATHAGGPSGPESAIPYGSRLRLKAGFPVHLYPPGAQVVLRTMQRYGIVLSDGGNIALTAEDDHYTDHTWDEVGITPQTFFQAVPSEPVQPGDFEVIDTGPRILETWDCVRTVEAPDPSALRGRLVRWRTIEAARVRLDWAGGGERVDIWRGGEPVATVDNTGTWISKHIGVRMPYRVCNAGSMACSDAVIPVPDRRTMQPGVPPPGDAAPAPSPTPPAPSPAPRPLPRTSSPPAHELR